MNSNPHDVERQLAALAPQALTLDRDALLYAAGYAAARRSRLSAVWPAATAVMTAATVLLALRGLDAPIAKPQAAAKVVASTPHVEAAPGYTAWWDFGPRPRVLTQLVAERELQLRLNQDSQLCCGARLPADALDIEDFTPAKAVTNRELLEEMLRPTM
jgi:hypothetical protein